MRPYRPKASAKMSTRMFPTKSFSKERSVDGELVRCTSMRSFEYVKTQRWRPAAVYLAIRWHACQRRQRSQWRSLPRGR
eukprot:scaffold438_cov250-Pinguiococcus_pyrenoidosus.AAC.14